MTSRCAKRANDRGDLIKSKNFFFRTESSFTRDFFVIQRASFTNFQIFVGKILFEERRGGERFSTLWMRIYTEIYLNLVQSKILDEVNTLIAWKDPNSTSVAPAFRSLPIFVLSWTPLGEFNLKWFRYAPLLFPFSKLSFKIIVHMC